MGRAAAGGALLVLLMVRSPLRFGDTTEVQARRSLIFSLHACGDAILRGTVEFPHRFAPALLGVVIPEEKPTVRIRTGPEESAIVGVLLFDGATNS